MYLVDTNVISEYRKKQRADSGVQSFFSRVIGADERVYISVITVGELRRGVELIRHRGDSVQTQHLESWLMTIIDGYRSHILGIDHDTAQLWGKLRVPHPENALDKLIAATAFIHNLTLVTRNDKHFTGTGVQLLNPFADM